MLKKLIAISIATASIHPALSYAEVDSSMFSVKGFGTIGAVHSSEDEADYVATPYQPNGAGSTRSWDMSVDSKLGVQLNANFSDKLSAVVQAVSQHQYDNSWRPVIEWANFKYQITPEVSVRLGRIVLPAFLISDSRMVGYSNPWVRPPEEVYFNTLTTNNDGIDVTWRKQFGDITNTVQAFAGRSTAKFENSEMKGKPDWGINDTIEIDSWTLRAGLSSYKIDFESDELDMLYGGIAQVAEATAVALPEASAAAYRLLDEYSLDDMKVKIYTLGASYDPGNWFAMGEYAHVSGESIIADADSFYVTAGYRWNAFTPYVTFAQVDTDRIEEEGIPIAVPEIDRLNAGIDAILSATASNQRSVGVGVRWDFMSNADLKVQYERKSLSDDSLGRLIAATQDFEANGDFNVISVAVDFVF